MKLPPITKGPWTARGECEDLEVINLDSDDPGACDGVRTIASVVQCGYEIPNYEESAHNAKAIAALPDLLAAAVKLSAWFDKHYPAHGRGLDLRAALLSAGCTEDSPAKS